VPKATADFAKTFDTLRAILKREGKKLLVTGDGPEGYQLSSPTMVDRVGRPMFVAAVQINKNYVSYHLMPVYSMPDLLKGLSPSLKKRMQGKSCFNFTAIDAAQVRELTALTRTGIKRFKNFTVPWDQTSKQD
jgi:hypothetical protein